MIFEDVRLLSLTQKAAFKREQCQTCLSSAEREQARLKVNPRKAQNERMPQIFIFDHGLHGLFHTDALLTIT